METNIFAQLFALQNEIGAISRTETNPFFKSKYFDINKLLEELKPMLEKHGLIVLQPLVHVDGKSAIKTLVISKETGEQIDSVTVIPENSDPQKMGAIITYFRRYALQSFFLLQAEDDDANSAKPVAQHAAPPSFAKPTVRPATPVSGSACNKCGAVMKQKLDGSGEYCSALCWKNAKPVTQPQTDVQDIVDEIPF